MVQIQKGSYYRESAITVFMVPYFDTKIYIYLFHLPFVLRWCIHKIKSTSILGIGVELSPHRRQRGRPPFLFSLYIPLLTQVDEIYLPLIGGRLVGVYFRRTEYPLQCLYQVIVVENSAGNNYRTISKKGKSKLKE